jgi:membrane associated rhomboid family serine protease
VTTPSGAPRPSGRLSRLSKLSGLGTGSTAAATDSDAVAPVPAADVTGAVSPVAGTPGAGAATRRFGRTKPEPKPWYRKIKATSWGGALLIMAVIAAVLFVVQLVNAIDHQHLDRFGLHPRTVSGLWGIITMPFLHATWWQLVSIVGPFILIGWVVMLSGVRTWCIATAVSVVVGGALAWAVAPDRIIVGVSPLVFGWTGYLVARALRSRKVLWILSAIAVVFFFSGLFGGLLPSINATVPWQAHVSGFVAGALAGWVLHPRPVKKAPTPAVS